MNLKVLTIEQMNRISAHWMSAEQALIIAKVPALTGIREDIQDAHQGLRVYVPLPTVASPQLVENRGKATIKDRVHDRSVRASIYLMQAAAELAVNEEEERIFRALLGVVYPDGLSTTGMSYEEEAGSADLRQKRLTTEDRELLKGLTFRSTNAWSLVETAIDAALTLGELEKQKRHLEQEATATPVFSASEAKRAQYNWIEMAKMVVQHSGRALKKQRLNQQEHDDLLEPLLNALSIAEKRHDDSTATATPESKPEHEPEAES